MTTAAKPARVPYADRPEARDKCKCVWVYSKDHDGNKTEHLYVIHPQCPLHGNDVKEAPF